MKSKEEIINRMFELTNLHPLKVRNIYVFGSRVYGTHKEESDYDLLVTACGLLAHTEIKDPEYNIHIVTPDKFEADLKAHDIHNLECIYAPDWAKVQIKTPYEDKFKLDLGRLQRYVHNQSFNSWGKGKVNIYDDNTDYGLKSMFHSLRMLMFANQIALHGKIINFSEANYLHKEIFESNETEWDYFRNKYLPFKVYLENQLKTLTGQNN